MPRDKKVLQQTTQLVKDFACNTLYRLPNSSFQKIAQDMINLGWDGDGTQIARCLVKEKKRIEKARISARKYGFAPFTNMGFYTYRWIREQYAGWVLPLMAERLERPEDIYAVWAVQFADAADALGRKACEDAEHLYSFVTASPVWLEAQDVRRQYLEEFKSHKLGQKLKRKSENRKNLRREPRARVSRLRVGSGTVCRSR